MQRFTFLGVVIISMALGMVAQERQTKLAVMEIEDKSGKLPKALLENAAEALRTEIGATNKFVLISKDRQRRAMIKEEKKESWKECYDQQCRIQLGQALTADHILTSMVTYFGETYTITAELIDLAKEATVKTAKAEFDGSEKGLAEAIKSIAWQIAGSKRGSTFQTGKIGEKVEEWEIGQGEETIVHFESVPSEAVVVLDGRMLCQKTPCSKMVAQGKHEVTIQKENYVPQTKVYDIKKGAVIKVSLEPDFGWIEVAANRDNVDVFLDGRIIGKTPIAKRELDPGPHQVEIHDPCFYQTGEKFVLKRSEMKTIRLELKEREAGVAITAQDGNGNDVDAEIVVDGKSVGRTPGTYKVPLCSKEIEVRAKAGVYRQKLALEEKKIATVRAVLKKGEPSRYEIRDEVVIDESASLMWQRKSAERKMEYEEAYAYCENLVLGGYSDWRLPTISELKTLIVGCQSASDACKVSDDCLSASCRSKGCSCPDYRGKGEDGFYWQRGVWQGGGNWFWSSSVLDDAPESAWRIAFDNGDISPNKQRVENSVRCVRSQP